MGFLVKAKGSLNTGLENIPTPLTMENVQYTNRGPPLKGWGLENLGFFITLKLTAIAVAPENRPFQKEMIVFQPLIFRCDTLVSGKIAPCRFLKHRTIFYFGGGGFLG